MSRDVIVPPARALLVDGGNVASRPYYTFFSALAANLKDLAAAVDDVTAGGGEWPFSPNANVIGGYSLFTQGILKKGIVRVLLTGDVEQPGHRWYYGSDDTGERGWFAIGDAFADSDNIVKTTDSDGITSFDLADLADSGMGSFKLVTRDAKGRLSGTTDGTTTDVPEGDNLYYTDARADARITLQKGQPSGLASLDAGGKLDAGQLPALAITETFVVNTQAAMLALAAEEGDVAVRTDESKSYILTTAPASTLANWQELLVPTGGVTSFNGRTGPVVPASGDYTFSQIDSTPTTLAGYGITDAATAAQGAKADSAVQPGDLAAVATSGDYDDLSNLPPSVYASITLGTAQSLVSGTNTIALDTVVADSHSFFSTSTHRFTPTIAGKYLVAGAVYFSTTAGDSGNHSLLVSCSKNGTLAPLNMAMTQITMAMHAVTHTMVHDMNGTTDYLVLLARFSDSNTRSAATGNTLMTIYRLGD